METTRERWLVEAEESLRDLRDIQGVSILAEDRNIREIHILATSGRSAKQIVRDVETCLRTRFNIGIDHRVVSVAFARRRTSEEAPESEVSTRASAPVAPAAEPPRELTAALQTANAARAEAERRLAEIQGRLDESLERAARLEHDRERDVKDGERRGSVASDTPSATARPEAPVATPRHRGERVAASQLRTDEARLRFVSVNVYVSGPRVQAQVELRWKGVSRMGSATGWASRDGAQRLVAQATLAAVQEFVEETWAMSLQDIEFFQMAKDQVVAVGLLLISHRHEKLLAACCPVEQDAQQAVVLATLAAVNRVVGSLPTREPTEYVLRPAPRQEESGAKKF